MVRAVSIRRQDKSPSKKTYSYESTDYASAAPFVNRNCLWFRASDELQLREDANLSRLHNIQQIGLRPAVFRTTRAKDAVSCDRRAIFSVLAGFFRRFRGCRALWTCHPLRLKSSR